MKEKVYPIGEVRLEVIDKKTKKVLEVRKAKNLIVTNGRNWMAKRLSGSGYSFCTDLAIYIGTNGTAPNISDTGLTSYYRHQSASSCSWDGVNNRIENYTTFTDFTETINICEAALYVKNEGMFNRVTFASIEMTPLKNLKPIFYINP